MVPAAVCETIWEKHNRRTFEGVEKEPRSILDIILAKIHGWLFLGQSREAPPFKFWIFEWDSVLF